MADTRAPTLARASRGQLAMRRVKVHALQAQRLLAWIASPGDWRRPAALGRRHMTHALYRRDVRLARVDPGADPALERGKRTNVALAAPRFDGLVLSPVQPLSFWRALGRCTAARGFRPGMELRGGCIVPSVGGGLCMLSNALFRMACELGWTILERHGHTMEAAPPAADEPLWGMDATVAWPHVDLRVAPAHGRVRLGVQVLGSVLTLTADSDTPARVSVELESVGDTVFEQDGQRMRSNGILRRVRDRASGALVREELVAESRRRLLHAHEQRRNCLTCGEDSCHARVRAVPGAP